MSCNSLRTTIQIINSVKEYILECSSIDLKRHDNKYLPIIIIIIIRVWRNSLSPYES